ncbi:MAG: RNA methyltransferase [Chloroflexi bacterium]|nr:RNA methyltransferase [Chloroflexota bacterium]
MQDFRSEENLLKPLSWYKKLVDKKSRLEGGVFLIEGEKSISQVLKSSPDSILEIISVDELKPVYMKYKHRILSESQIKSISSNVTPQRIIAVVKLPLEVYSGNLPGKPGDRILLLENVQDPGNVGTLIRTAAAFNFSGIILTTKCADPFSSKVVQASAGSVLSLWLRVTDIYLQLAEELKEQGNKLIAADLAGSDDINTCYTDKFLLVLGNEASGLSTDILQLANCRIKIPVIQEKAESLNVASCGAIFMFLAVHGTK